MVRVTCKVDFSDVDKAFETLKREVREAMTETGKTAVEYAKQHGSYKNRTGTLRKSNRYEVSDNALTLINDAASPKGYNYASTVEDKGYDVLSGAALYAESELKKKTR